MGPTQDEIKAGYIPYTKGLLSIYDTYVIGLSASYVWRCPSSQILDLYNQNVSNNHLDVGIGTGHFLNACQFPSNEPRLGLMDANPNCLEWAKNRLLRYQPELYKQDVFSSPANNVKPFDSLGLNYVLHCLPGARDDKSRVVQNLKSFLRPGGIFFGSTIVSDNNLTNPLSRMVLRLYNRIGAFSNLQDTRESTEWILANNFDWYELKTQGCIVSFRAR